MGGEGWVLSGSGHSLTEGVELQLSARGRAQRDRKATVAPQLRSVGGKHPGYVLSTSAGTCTRGWVSARVLQERRKSPFCCGFMYFLPDDPESSAAGFSPDLSPNGSEELLKVHVQSGKTAPPPP